MSSVLGIDISSYALDFVKLDETTGRATWTRRDLVGPTAFARLRDTRDALPPASFYDDVYLAAIERPKTRSFTSAAALFPVFGAVVASIPPTLELWDVAPTAWRAELGLAGNASKQECARAVHAICFQNGPGGFGYIAWPQDALDAYAVAHYARTVNQRGIEAA